MYDLSGKKFGAYLVLGRSEKSSMWISRCDCGEEKEVSTHSLVDRGVSRCVRCYKKERKGKRTCQKNTQQQS